MGLLVALKVLPADEIAGYAALGELALDGGLIGVAGVLPAAIMANARSRGLICPEANGGEAAWAGGAEVLAPKSLLALVNHFKGSQVLSKPGAPPLYAVKHHSPRKTDLLWYLSCCICA